MAYIAPIHQPSSVRHALRLKLIDPEEECLVVAKSNRLELYEIAEDGYLSLKHTKAIYGKVTVLQKIRPSSSETDHLVVATDRYVYFTLSWHAATKQLQTEKTYVDLAERSARESQTGERCLVDPSSRVATLEVFEGIVTVLPIIQKTKRKTLQGELGSLGDPVSYRISEMFVRSSAFLYPRTPQVDKPTLALLYEDTLGKIYLKLRQIEYPLPTSSDESGELKLVEGLDDELELGASHLIPVPEPTYGLLIIGETSIAYYNDDTKEAVTQHLDEATIFVAWEKIDGQRFVLADDYGKLYLLMLILGTRHEVIDWQLDVLGETSRASVLTYLDGGRLFVGSHQGDSQVVRISEKSLEIVQNFANIAPILDFTVMDLGNRSTEGQSNPYSSGQARIVTGSGAYKDGSLRSVRSGVGLEDIGGVGEIEHISALFSLSSNPRSASLDTLVATFVNETRVFEFSADGEAEEQDVYKGFDLSQSTLLASNLPSERGLQVTSTSVRISDLESGMVVSEWSPPSAVTAVAASGSHVILALGGIRLVSLDVRNDIKVQAEQKFSEEKQVACITASDDVCFVGFWQDAEVAILDVKDFRTISSIQVAEESVPRALLVAQIFESAAPTLFVAMADGSVLTFSVSAPTYQFSDRTSIVLGTQPANFTALPRDNGIFNVFASSEHPSLIYASEGRLVYSAVTAEKATAVCSFDSEAFPEAVAIADPKELRLALIDSERTTHVQTLVVNETVRRIAYSPSLKAFGMGTIERRLKNGVEFIKSHFQLADEIAFKKLDTFALNTDELVESLMRCELNDGGDDLAERFVVGTAYLEAEDIPDAPQGRILILEVTEDRKLKLVHEQALKGGCRCLGLVAGHIVAALIKTLVLFSFEYRALGTPQLVKKASYRCSTAPIDLHVTGNTIVVADLMKSITIVQYKPSDLGKPAKLEEVARHFATAWTSAVAQVDENTYLESDAEGNLLVLYRDLEGATDEDKRRLRVSSELLLGELVNKIRRIDVSPTADAVVLPKAFMATVEGAIYLFGLIHPSRQNLLMNLQNRLAEYVQSPGNVPFNSYRAYKTQVRQSEEPYRFVDGDLIERFLDCPREIQEQAIDGLEVDLEEMTRIVEGLRMLH